MYSVCTSMPFHIRPQGTPPDLLQGKAALPEGLDHLEVEELRRAVVAVPVRIVNEIRDQDAHPLIMEERVLGDLRQPGEFPDPESLF